MNYKNFTSTDQKFDCFNNSYTDLNDEEIQEYFKIILSELPDQHELEQLDKMLKFTVSFIKQFEKKLTPCLPYSMEYFFFDSIKSAQKRSILSGFFAIFNFLTKNDDICQRFITIGFHDYLIQNVLFSNKFNNEYSMDMSFSIYHLIDFYLSQNRNADFIQNFFIKYQMSSFMNSRIDIIDRINFLVCFSKYSLTREIASEVVDQMLKLIFIKELAGQLTWIMYYITRNDINNIDLFFFHPKYKINDLNNIFYKISGFLEEKIVDELFYIGYLKFCITSLLHLDKYNQIFQIIIQHQVSLKILKNFDLFSPSSECKQLLIKFLNITHKYDKEILSDDVILKVLQLATDSKISVINQTMIFLINAIPVSSIELITKIFRDKFFINCIDGINSSIDTIILSKLIFLIFEKVEPIHSLFIEYVTIHADYNTADELSQAIEQYSGQNEQNLKCLTEYLEKLKNAVSMLEGEEK